MGSALALLLHGLLLWGLFSLNPQTTTPLLAPSSLSVDIWPDLSRMNARSNKIQATKNRKVTAKDKLPNPVATHVQDAPAVTTEAASDPMNLPPDLVRALRTRQACQKALAEGKDVPADCPRSNPDMATLPLLPADKAAYWDKVVAAQETYRRYKTSAGNTDYWRRVTGLRNYRDDTLRPGAYSDPKWQKFFNADINPDSAHQRERDGN